ncbi:MAG: hypothetical protein LHW60_05435 [Candidatus Cloacimonetes bacterium]|jgi:hypothetical protein|nr:hypothetical protein [Candidatus Cloacimonadota bacterium]NLO44100.1 hypothetical protein [Candidatus Cloacimonadota bacterium]
MKTIFEYSDEDLGKSYIVVDHIREISKTLGDIVITFTNGDRKVLNVLDANAILEQLLEEIRNS